jgi:hypothetical protein
VTPPAVEEERPAAEELAPDRERERAEVVREPLGAFGRFPVVAALTAVGLAICSATNILNRATLAPSIWFLWLGIAFIVVPIVYRLCSAEAGVGERVALVCLFGLSLYAVKVMRDPFGYTIPDEWFHEFNAQAIASSHHLFTHNSILPVSARYPGLEGATSALMSLTGMSSFGAGLIIIAAARLTLMLGLLVLFFWISRSWVIASLGAVLYAGNGNFLLWNAQFSYESLSLPLLVVVLAVVVQRASAADLQRREWAVPLVLGIAAIAITHHITSYLLCVLLLLLASAAWLSGGRLKPTRLWPFAVLAITLTVGWLVVVASDTVGYISPVVTQAFNQTLNTLLGEAAPRAPFASAPGNGGVPSTGLAEQILAYGGLVLLLIALPFGLRAVWRHHRRNPVALLLGLAALGFFAVLGLRLAPSAWEIANRMGEFFYIGLGFVVAYAVVERVMPGRWRTFAPAAIAGSAAVVVIGGAITGWPPDNILSEPVTKVVTNSRHIQSEAIAVGRWVGAHLPGSGFGAYQSDARTILVYGDGHVLTGTQANVGTALSSWTISKHELALLRVNGVRYMVVDRRVRADDDARGYAFSLHPPGGHVDELNSAQTATKFDHLPAARVYDSGNVSVYDLQSAAPAQ